MGVLNDLNLLTPYFIDIHWRYIEDFNLIFLKSADLLQSAQTLPKILRYEESPGIRTQTEGFLNNLILFNSIPTILILYNFSC